VLVLQGQWPNGHEKFEFRSSTNLSYISFARAGFVAVAEQPRVHRGVDKAAWHPPLPIPNRTLCSSGYLSQNGMPSLPQI
jgi:hypothetical protein